MDPNNPFLRDIHGLDSAPLWPVAPGWWVLLAAGVAILLLGAWWRRARVHSDWRADAYAQLRQIRANRRRTDPREVLAELSELLRRIAIARFGRRVAAGLSGEAWLEWLERHDPSGFDWRTDGRILIEAPYAPPGAPFDPAHVGQVIEAVRGWVGGESGPEGLDMRAARRARRGWLPRLPLPWGQGARVDV
jgi:hypothetical protein